MVYRACSYGMMGTCSDRSKYRVCVSCGFTMWGMSIMWSHHVGYEYHVVSPCGKP